MMRMRRLILLFLALISLTGCAVSQNASENEVQIDTIVNAYVQEDRLHNDLSTSLRTLTTVLADQGSVYHPTSLFRGVSYIFVSQYALTHHDASLHPLSDALQVDYPAAFSEAITNFIRKVLYVDAHRGSRFYDLSRYVDGDQRLAIIIIDEQSLVKQSWPHPASYNDAFAFMVLHEMAHALAGDSGSPIYDYLINNITSDGKTLEYYNEAFADLLALILLEKTMSFERAKSLRHEMIKYRKNTKTHHSHNTAPLLKKYRLNHHTNKIEIAGILLSH